METKPAACPGTPNPDLSEQRQHVIPPVTGSKGGPPLKPTVVYAAENTDFFVETTPTPPTPPNTTDIVSADSYPWKKKLCIPVRRLSDFEISYWCGPKEDGTDHPIKVETPPVQELMLIKQEADHSPVKKHKPVLSYERSHVEDEALEDQSTEKLLAHAKSLIKRVGAALGTTDELKTNSTVNIRSSRVSGTVKQPTPQLAV